MSSTLAYLKYRASRRRHASVRARRCINPERCSEASSDDGLYLVDTATIVFFSHHLATKTPMNAQRSPAARDDDDTPPSPKRKKVRSKYAPKAW